MVRLYVSGPLAPGAALDATPEQARYLLGVMRLRDGDELGVFNGQDGEWRAAISAVTKRGCRLDPVEQTRSQTAPSDLELVMSLVKRGPLELTVEKATELGVGRIRLATTRRTNADHTNVSRLTAIAIEAAEQCERLDLPEIDAPDRLDRLLEAWPDGRRLLFCDETAPEEDGGAPPARPLLAAVNAAGPGPWSVLIGPEGGFDPAERSRLLDHPSVTPVSLGPRILRAETAAIVALALVQASRADP